MRLSSALAGRRSPTRPWRCRPAPPWPTRRCRLSGAVPCAMLGDVKAQVDDRAITLDIAATEIVAAVGEYGLRWTPAPLAEKVTVDDLGVVCWMAVLPPRQAR